MKSRWLSPKWFINSSSLALGAVGIAIEGTEAVVAAAEVEVSRTQMKTGPVSLPAWSFCVCLGGSLVLVAAGWV